MIDPIYFLFDIIALSRAPITSVQKWEIFWTYLRLTLRKILIQQHLKKDLYKVKFLHFYVSYPNFENCLSLFSEIFLHNVYFFRSNQRKPFIIDCGTNVGIAVLYFKYLYPQAKILCFEPNSESLAILKENIQQNNLKDISIFPVALSNKIETKIFFSRIDSQAGATAGLFIEKDYTGKFTKRKIKTDLLSKYIKEKVDLLKVDIEGAETAVFSDLETSGKIKNIKETVVEFHLNCFYKKPDLSIFLRVLEKNKFAYILHAVAVPLYQPNKLQNLLVYARK